MSKHAKKTAINQHSYFKKMQKYAIYLQKYAKICHLYRQK